jgi:glutaminyl-peptide cyclotransferase
MSDGSDTLQLRDSETFELINTVVVQPGNAETRLLRLNELECVDHDVYANVFEYRHIVRIAMPSGEITAWIDTRNLLRRDDVEPELTGDEADLNGIAYRPERARVSYSRESVGREYSKSSS